MRWTTPVTVQKSDAAIDYRSQIFSVGSCFAVNIAEKLSYYKFRNSVNPFGILFHPLAIDELLHRSVNGIRFTESDLFFKDGVWRSFDVHSEMNDTVKDVMVQTLNSALETTVTAIKSASHIIITYGTAWVYREIESQNVVANCNKADASKFEKEILPVETIEAAILHTVSMVRELNPSAQIIFTVSPVRHIKDGIVENQRSKAHLLCGLHQVLDANPSGLDYFPSYEIMMDELRDYRYYAADMIHPSNVAIDYIWDRFVYAHLSADTLRLMKEVGSIQKAASHRPFNANTAEYRAHLDNMSKKIENLRNEIPYLSFE